MKNKTVIIEGIKIVQNPLTGAWFIFAKTRETNEEATIFGKLNDMKKCAKFAAKNNTIIQD